MINIQDELILVMILFFLGFMCLIVRKNLLYLLIGLEIMLNSLGLMTVFIGNYLKVHNGSMMYIFIITIAACEASIGLAFLINIYKNKNTLNIDSLREMKK
ncbi:NADH-quinone oxidoreductase subunit NuoK [Buchnera aphidicola]|uniref:NADH-quinone oxidoreductase subunit NuoK n=1 Tax=Buchnera aphidicola TaxID=9 RepID=UPI0020936800|nr:NADH-quinone oxidoreductase subunit NuoK [Buchnera aphidicola]USS94244.1 NADH-quinone oxidoreductase subunit NuoK [Buchnera aphidicola (Sipha maydis)]WII23794.1 NADH-quinone oxidoreductase subunit NuoK [Buchnera aphidicola (Sipha maydis)]